MQTNFSPLNKKSLLHVIVLSTLAVFAESAYAADQDAGALQRQLQDQVEKSRPEVQEQKTEKPAEQVEADPNAQRIELKGYLFKGNTLISDADLQHIVAPWNHRTLSIAELKQVTVAIQEAYSKQSRIAQVNVPPQEIQDGVLLIEVIEGRLGDVIVESTEADQPLRFSEQRASRFVRQINKKSRFIDTQSVYRSLTLLNELPGVKASATYQPGKDVGVSDLKLNLRNTPLLSGQVATSNYGSSSTGEAQAIANLNISNPLGLGDIVRLDGIQSEGSSYVQGAYTVPLGYNGLKFGVQSSYLTYKTLADWSSNRAEGDASTIGFNASYALTRKPGSQSNLRMGLENRAYSNDNSGMNISKYDITAFTLGLNGSLADSDASYISWGASLGFGDLNISNAAQSQQDEASAKTAGSFQKLSFNISLTQDLSLLANTQWLVSAYGQMASKNLNSSEQFYLGGPYGLRAYPVSQGGGDEGVIVSTELSHRFADHWSASVFADIGAVEQHKALYANWQGLTHANNVYSLADAGVSLKFNYKKFSVSSMAAYRLGDNPLYTTTGKQLNADNEYQSLQLWLRGSLDF